MYVGLARAQRSTSASGAWDYKVIEVTGPKWSDTKMDGWVGWLEDGHPLDGVPMSHILTKIKNLGADGWELTAVYTTSAETKAVFGNANGFSSDSRGFTLAGTTSTIVYLFKRRRN
jgi:hypothetical protein